MILSDAEKTKIGKLIKVAGKALITTAVKKKIGVDLKETIDSGINALSTEKKNMIRIFLLIRFY